MLYILREDETKNSIFFFFLENAEFYRIRADSFIRYRIRFWYEWYRNILSKRRFSKHSVREYRASKSTAIRLFLFKAFIFDYGDVLLYDRAAI